MPLTEQRECSSSDFFRLLLFTLKTLKKFYWSVCLVTNTPMRIVTEAATFELRLVDELVKTA